MFKLKKLELLGFKSFGDRTRMEFSDGIVAVVGPNGCGKSNLSDAISWVLGEQSARLLRGERMADVIFNGTGTRLPTGMAEVSLTLVDPEYEQAGAEEPANGKRQSEIEKQPDAEFSPPSDHAESGNGDSDAGPHSRIATPPSPLSTLPASRAGEITVTRRLFRSGESEYLINGEISRLRDIQDLFMGTGLGPESYAIIEQGRIGQILSSKPSDRRAIIEEAAGVSKFKTRKRLAEGKLESSRQNLARITDILEEVSTQVNSLKRQASKARRHRELHEELRQRQRVVLTSRLIALEAERHRVREELTAIQDQCSEAAQELENVDQQQKAAALRHEGLEGRLTELREQVAQADLERERLQSRLDQARQLTVHLTARIAESSQECEQLRAEVASLDQEAGELHSRGEELRRDSAAAQETAMGLLARQEQLSAEVTRSDQELESSRQSLLEAVSRVADLRNQLIQVQEMGLATDRQMTRAQTEKAAAEEEHRRVTAALDSFSSDDQRESGEVTRLAQSVLKITAALREAEAEEAARRAEVEKLRQEFSAAVARKQALDESLARHAYSTESVRRLLSASIPINGHEFQPLGVLADFVEVSPGYEEVVEDFLKQELDCVVVERHEEARSGIALLRGEGAGRSTFFVTQFPSNGRSNGHADRGSLRERGVVAPLCELVQFDARLRLNGDLALPSLVNAYLVEDGATAERLAGKYPDCHFLTKGGEHYRHRLVSGGKGSSAGPLALRREFRELERRVRDLESTTRQGEESLAKAAAEKTHLDEELRLLTAAHAEAERKAALASEKVRQARESFDRAEERLRILRAEEAALEEERQTLRARESELGVELQMAQSEQLQREEGLNQKAHWLRSQRTQLDQLGQELIEAQSRSKVLEERTQAMDAERTRLLTQAEGIRSRLTKLEEQIEKWGQEQLQLAEESEGLRARFGQHETTQRLAREQVSLLEQESQAARTQRDELGPRADEARAALDARREKRSEMEVQLARAESDLAHHTQQCRQDLNAEPASLLAEFPREKALAGDALQAGEEALRELRTRLDNLGPVNMMALEELQEAEERMAFLETQRQDLLASIDDTAQAIREIDQVSRQQFLEAFKAINANFAESFRALFGGGTGEMRLSDESDLESGIDVVAQPPGKRLQNVLLLSGGEKAMAALALLIAIFRYTPSPFCILDEVDAPLDESNIDRFTRMIQQMSRHTQFILITHNKRTMETSQVMYGVTMEEPGISKLVSVRFDKIERAPVPALAASA